MKRQYRQIKSDPIQFAKMQQRLAEIQTSSAAELFGEASFLSKMLHRTLSDAQAALYARALEESRAFGHRADGRAGGSILRSGDWLERRSAQAVDRIVRE